MYVGCWVYSIYVGFTVYRLGLRRSSGRDPFENALIISDYTVYMVDLSTVLRDDMG